VPTPGSIADGTLDCGTATSIPSGGSCSLQCGLGFIPATPTVSCTAGILQTATCSRGEYPTIGWILASSLLLLRILNSKPRKFCQTHTVLQVQPSVATTACCSDWLGKHKAVPDVSTVQVVLVNRQGPSLEEASRAQLTRQLAEFYPATRARWHVHHVTQPRLLLSCALMGSWAQPHAQVRASICHTGAHAHRTHLGLPWLETPACLFRQLHAHVTPLSITFQAMFA
jgi:hypothetical protein